MEEKKALDKNKVYLSLLLAAIIVLAAAFVILILSITGDNGATEPSGEYEPVDVIEYNGKKYELRDDVETVLVMGLDQMGESSANNSYNNDLHADFLMLLVIDNTDRTVDAIPISRDTIANVTVLGIGGKQIDKIPQQISLAHSYGSGGLDSCRNVSRAVSDLLGIKIDYCASLKMDAVRIVTDKVGGVEVVIPEDMTMINEKFVEGETVFLTGEEALQFVTGRQGLDDSTNHSRMKRQAMFIDSLYERLYAEMRLDEELDTELIELLTNYMVSNCSSSELERLSDKLRDYIRGKTYNINGEYTVGDFMEFHADEDSVKSIVVELFYNEK